MSEQAKMPESEMSPDEARDLIIEAARFSVRYWATNDPKHRDGTPYTVEERIAGAMFTFLAELDGTGNLPACDIVVLHSDEDGNAAGETRVSTMLHEFFYEPPKSPESAA